MQNLPDLIHETAAALTAYDIVDRLLRWARRLLPPGTGRHRRPRR